MKTVSKSKIVDILKNANSNDLLTAIETSFLAYSQGLSVVPPVGTLSFNDPPGDVHIKYGYIKEDDHYVIKIASGFYDNPKIGLGSSNGLNLVFNASNGLLECILLDEGHLTDIRTAVAGTFTAKLLAPSNIGSIGIVGTGTQARLQLQHLAWITNCRDVLVWGRKRSRSENYCKEMSETGFNVKIARDTEELYRNCDVIVTTTPSTEPLIEYIPEKRDMLIIAMGADTVGKQELSEDILVNASLLVADSKSQAIAHGEVHKSIINKKIHEKALTEIGTLLSDEKFERPEGLIVADLTGIATQDIMISKYILERLSES